MKDIFDNIQVFYPIDDPNIIKQSNMFDNLDDITIRIDGTINEQITTNKNEEYILRKWENMKKYFEFIQKIDDEKFYL
ncbi:MAG: hypothetical protein ACXWEW_00890 [Nitrososphaeraceae archaeon]